MTGKIVVYIGLPKTATTTLQSNVFPGWEGDKMTYLGVNQPRQLGKQAALYSSVVEAVNAGEGVEATRAALESAVTTGSTVLLSEEMFTVSSDCKSWEAKLKNLASLLEGIDSRLLVTVREPASALFSYYVERYPYFSRYEKPFMELASTDDDMMVFHCGRLSQVLLDFFSKEQIFVYSFEEIIAGRLNPLYCLVTGCSDGSEWYPLKKSNEKKRSMGYVYTGGRFTLADIDSFFSSPIRQRDHPVAVQSKRLFWPLVRQLETVTLKKAAVPVPSMREFAELRVYLEPETAALYQNFGVKYESR